MNLIKETKRTIILVVGVTLLILGLLFLFLPGSGMLLLWLGFAVLASEFWWARKLWEKAKKKLRR